MFMPRADERVALSPKSLRRPFTRGRMAMSSKFNAANLIDAAEQENKRQRQQMSRYSESSRARRSPCLRNVVNQVCGKNSAFVTTMVSPPAKQNAMPPQGRECL